MLPRLARRRLQTLAGVVTIVIAAVAGCDAPEQTRSETPIDLPPRNPVDAGDPSVPDPGENVPSNVVVASSTDGGTCDTADGGGLVYCVRAGTTFTATGTLTYGSGFAAGLPAMGLGKPGLGYIPQSHPFTCLATGGMRAVGTNNSGQGKTCEVRFDNVTSTPVSGAATFVLTVDTNATEGVYDFGLTATTGAVVLERPFSLRVVR